MAVFIIIAGVVGIFAIGAGWYMAMPMVIALVEMPQWNTAEPDALIARDRTLAFIYFFPLVMFGWIVVWGYMRASKSSMSFE